MDDSNKPQDDPEYVSNVVAESRERGQALYEQYSRSPTDGSWSKAEDGTIRFSDNNMEITPQGDLAGPYAEMGSFLNAHGLSGPRGDGKNHMEAGHILAAETCEKAGIDPKTAPCIAVDASGHMNDLHGSAGFLSGSIYKDVDHMIDDHRSVYSSLGAPEWGERAASFIDSHRAAIESSLQEQQRELPSDLPEPNAKSECCEPSSESVFESMGESSAVNDYQESNATKY